MAITVAELNAKLTADTRDFSKGMKQAEQDSDGFTKRAGSKFAAFGKVAVAGLAVAGTAAAAFGVKAVSLASDVNESLSKVNAVFGASAKEIDQWSKQTAGSIGLPRGAALDAAGSFGNMFDQLGIGAKESAKMSTGMVNLAADFASFHNADITDVIAAQSAAFRGEYDSLQRFLPLINAASVEQKALAMTGKTATKELTQQEKALAVHALMLEGAGEAQGDFARTSDGLANKMRIMKAKATDFAAGVGNVLLPVVIKAFEVLEKVGGFLKTVLTPVFEVIRGGIYAFASAWTAADGDITSSGFPGLMERIAMFMVTVVVPAFKKVIEFIGNLVGAFTSGEGKAGEFAQKLGETFSALIGVVRPAFDAIVAVVSVAFRVLVDLWDTVGIHLFNGVTSVLGGVLEAFRGVFNAIKGVFDVFAGIFTGDWDRVWDGLKAIVDGVWDAIVGVVRGALLLIPRLLAGAAGLVAEGARAMWDGMVGAFKSVLNLLIDAWNRLDFGIDIRIPTWVPGIGGRGFTIQDIIPDLPRLHQGGTVPGVRGQEVPIMAQAGERVIPANRAGGTSVVVNFHGIVGDPDAVARMIQDVLLDRQRRSGSLGFA